MNTQQAHGGRVAFCERQSSAACVTSEWWADEMIKLTEHSSTGMATWCQPALPPWPRMGAASA